MYSMPIEGKVLFRRCNRLILLCVLLLGFAHLALLPPFEGFDAGAMWEDFKVGVGHLTGLERVAVVTDVDWIRHAVGVFRFLMPGTVRVFPTNEAAAARSWIAAA